MASSIILVLLFAISSQKLGPTAYRAQKEERKGSGLGTVLLTYLFILVCSKWGDLLRHRFVTPNRKFWKKKSSMGRVLI